MIEFLAEYAVSVVFMLIIIVGLTTVTQENEERARLAIAYSFALLLHWFFAFMAFEDYGELVVMDLAISHGSLYFWTAAGADSLFIAYIVKTYCLTNLSKELIFISCASIACNMIGWAMYLKDVHVPLYNLIFIALYALAIYSLLKPEPKNAGNNRNSHRRITFWANAHTRHSLNTNH